MYELPNFHLYVGVPPFIGLAVKVSVFPAQIVLVPVTVTDGVTTGLTVIVTPEEVTVAGTAQARELVISNEYTSPFAAAVVV